MYMITCFYIYKLEWFDVDVYNDNILLLMMKNNYCCFVC